MLPSLHELNLQLNSLTAFPDTVFQSEQWNETHLLEIPQMLRLTLFGNQLLCDSSMCWIKVRYPPAG